MVASQNGWRANDRTVIASIDVPGGKLAVRKGSIGVIFQHLANRFHNEVEKLVWPGNWGYAEREVRGGTDLSNHASGTAIDLNAPKHPLGTAPSANYSAAQINKIHEIVNFYEGIIRWGGDYVGRKDGMHFEINDGINETQVDRIASKCMTATPKFTVTGAFLEGANRYGRAGNPVNAEGFTRDGLGRVQTFEHAIALWHKERTGAKAYFVSIPGAIYDYWRGRGAEDPENPTSLGYPVSDDAVWQDGKGVGQVFERGLIVWGPDTGVHAVVGPIRDTWEYLGAERNLGYPVNDQRPEGSSFRQAFQRGDLVEDLNGKVVMFAKKF